MRKITLMIVSKFLIVIPLYASSISINSSELKKELSCQNDFNNSIYYQNEAKDSKIKDLKDRFNDISNKFYIKYEKCVKKSNKSNK